VAEKQRQCRCGAIYHRTEAMAPSREIDSFECTACGATLENWDSAWVPTYRLIAAPAEPAIEISKPAIKPDGQADTPAQTGERGPIAPDRS
jgi:hypothetical protein